MKNIKRDVVTALFIMSMLFVPLVAAQQELNVPIQSGETNQILLASSDVTQSTTLGGLLAETETYTERFIDFSGQKIWVDNSTTLHDFVLQAHPVGDAIGTLTLGSIFQTSEPVQLLGMTSPATFDTYVLNNVNDLSDDDNGLQGETGTITWQNGDAFQITSITESTISGQLSGSSSLTVNGNGFFNYLCDSGSVCPTVTEIEDRFGIDVNDTFGVHEGEFLQLFPNSRFVMFRDVNDTYYLISDFDYSNTYDFDTSTTSYQVSSLEKTALGILPTGSYNLYSSVI